VSALALAPGANHFGLRSVSGRKPKWFAALAHCRSPRARAGTAVVALR
jgi:hypothetical protein